MLGSYIIPDLGKVKLVLDTISQGEVTTIKGSISLGKKSKKELNQLYS